MIGCAIRQAGAHLRVDVRFGAAKSRPRHTSNPKHAYAKRLRFELGSPVYVRQAAWDFMPAFAFKQDNNRASQRLIYVIGVQPNASHTNSSQ